MNRVLAQFPVTFGLGLSWVVVFTFMAWMRPGPELSIGGLLAGQFIQPATSHSFGDLTSRELYAGHLWRTITATFVHFNLLHLVLNLIGFLQLGRLIESWYGSAQFLAIYVVIAFLGNLGSGALRPIIGEGALAASIHSGGGSTVLLGLIGLVTVVGWRSPSEFPRGIRFWTSIILLVSMLLGFLIPNIDNLSHASGALVGAVIGRADRFLLEGSHRTVARLAALLASVALLTSFGAMLQQWRAEARAEAREDHRQQVIQELARLEVIYFQLVLQQQVFLPRAPNPLRLGPLFLPTDKRLNARRREALRAVLQRLARIEHGFDEGSTAEDYRALRRIASRALIWPPSPRDLMMFRSHLRPLVLKAQQDLIEARATWNRLRYPPPRIGKRFLNPEARP
ncbi:hypothetical protein BH23PLA1_BH23PLA1_38490 [soil metagenome]